MDKIKKDITIVTAFKDIGRSNWEGEVNGQPIAPYIKRTTETYIERFKRLTKLKNNIIVYVESSFTEEFQRLIEFDPAIHRNIHIRNLDPIWEEQRKILDMIGVVQRSKEFKDFIVNKSSPEYWSPEYVYINYLKSSFVRDAYKTLLMTDVDVAWIDFGYAREDYMAPEGKTFRYDTKEKVNIFCNGRVPQGYDLINLPIFNVVKNGTVLIQGCHIISDFVGWCFMVPMMNHAMMSLLNVGFVDDDQTLLLMTYRSAPDQFFLKMNDNQQWFNVIKENSYD